MDMTNTVITAQEGKAHRRALLLADGDELTYRVMRCVCEAGLQVHVLGTSASAAARLARSRYCASLHMVETGAWATGAALPQVNALVRDLGVDFVLPTDPVTTRFVVWFGSGIAAETFPVPEPATFESLINKDSFARVCDALALPHPPTRVCSDPGELLAMLDSFDGRALMVKPTDGHAGQGVWKLERDDDATRDRIRNLLCRPIIVQEFIDGVDVNALLYCKRGKIVASIAYRLGAREFNVVDDPQIWAMLGRAADALRLDGAIGFDMRLETCGRLWLLECNPRFTYEGSLMAFLCGYNIIREFLVPGSLASRAPASRVHRAKLMRPWSLLSSDLRHARYLLTDPRHSVPQACREFYQGKLRGALPGFGT